MEFEIFTQFDTINEEEWDALVSQNSINAPFLMYGYQRAWWDHKGGGEWPNAELRIIAGKKEGKLIGIAPLFVGLKNREPQIHFVGSIEISDYLDFIATQEHTHEFITGVFRVISEENTQFPGFIQLFNIPDDSPSLEVIQEISSNGKWNIEIEQAYHTPKIKLSADWETYLAGIDKKQRHEIRRKLRRAAESEDTVSWYMTKEKDALDADINAFFTLMENDEEKKLFLSDSMRKQMHTIIHWAFDAGLLQLAFLTINGEKAAAYLCFDHQERIYVYNSGFSSDFQYYSPGWVLLSYLIQNAIETSKTIFDFMRGDENYKYKFGAVDSFVMKVKAERTLN